MKVDVIRVSRGSTRYIGNNANHNQYQNNEK